MCEVTNNADDYRQFVKFAKFFTTRLVQAVVQSRLGHTIIQSCYAEPDASDWFNVRVDELGEIAAYMRANISRYPPASSCVGLEFLLSNVEGDILPLESWCVRFDSTVVDASVNIRTKLYHQLGTMLKSAIAASRVTPTYRYYARKQSPETFIILYRVCEGEPQLDLGEGQRKFRIGVVSSPFGSLCVELSYRTRLEIDPSTRCNEGLEVKSSPHRSHSNSPTCPTDIPFGVVPVTGGVLEAVSPVSDIINNFNTSPTGRSDVVFETNSPQRTNFCLGHSLSSSDESLSHQRHFETYSSDEPIFGMESSSSPQSSSSAPLRSFTTQVLQQRNHSFPFAALLTATSSNVDNDEHSFQSSDINISTANCSTPVTVTTTATCMRQSATVPVDVNLMRSSATDAKILNGHSQNHASADDEDVLSEDEGYVKVAFANSGMMDVDLGEFVKECRLAPLHLSGFQTDNPASIPSLLAEFESHQEMFDSFVSKMRTQVNEEEA